MPVTLGRLHTCQWVSSAELVHAVATDAFLADFYALVGAPPHHPVQETSFDTVEPFVR
jgi:hypothetical protein